MIDRRQISAIYVVLVVTAASLMGMVLGGAFGLAAGLVSPDMFRRIIVPWAESEPIGTALVLGAVGGVLCGGALGAFAIAAQVITSLMEHRASERDG